MNRFIDQLYREKRITSMEKYALKTDAETNAQKRYNYSPVQRNDGPFFNDKARYTYGQKGVQNDAGSVGYVPKAQQTTAAAQSAPVTWEDIAGQKKAPEAAQAEIKPQHHHSGVDLVKHDDAEKVIGTEIVEKTVSQLTEEKTVQEDTAQERPAEEKTVREDTVQERPAEEKPVLENTVQERPAEEKPVRENTVQERPAEEKPVRENTVQERPAEEKPVREDTAQERPAEEKPVQENTVQERPAQQMPAAAVHTMPEQRAVPMSSAEYNNRQPLPEWARPQAVQRPLRAERPKRQKKQYSSAAVLTGIGITFVALAGIIFSRAFWVQMSDWTRVGVLAGQAVLFFAMFGFAHKKLKIEGTAAAVYILGSVFATIAYITMGYFGLMGAWYGFEGGGMMLFLAMGALLVTFFSAGAMKVFSKPFCEYAACVSMAISGTLVLAQFANYFEYNKYAAFSMLISAAGLLASIVFYGSKSAGKEISKPVEITYKLVKGAYAFIAAPCLLADFAGRNEIIGWSLFGWGLWLIYTGETLWHAIRKKSEQWLAFHAVLLLTSLPSLYMTLGNYAQFTLIITIFSAVGSWAYILLDSKKALLFRADKVHSTMRLILTLVTAPVLFIHPVDSPLHLAVLIIWVIDFAAMASYYRLQALLIPQCAAILSLSYEFILKLGRSSIANGEELASLIILMVGILGTGVYRYLDRKGKTLFNADATNIIMRVLMSLPAALYLTNELNRWDRYCWAMCLLMIAELSVYAVLYRREREIFFRFPFIAAAVFMLIPNNFYAYGIEKAHLYALIMFGMSVVLTAAYMILRHYKKTLFDAKRFIYSAKAVIGGGCLLLVYADEQSHGCFSWVSWTLIAGLAVETLVYAIIKKNKYLLLAHNVCLAIMLCECGILMNDVQVFALFVTALLAVLTMIYFYLEKKNKLRFSALSSIIMMRGFFGLVALSSMVKYFGSWNWECFGLGIIIATEMLYYSISRRSSTLLLGHMAALSYSLWQVRQLVNDPLAFALWSTAILAVLTMVYVFLKKKNKLLFRADIPVMLMRGLFGLIALSSMVKYLGSWNIECFGIGIIAAAEMLYYSITKRSKGWLFCHMAALSYSLLQVRLLVDDGSAFALWSTALLALLTMLYFRMESKGKLLFNATVPVLLMRGLFGIMAIYCMTDNFSTWNWDCFGLGIIFAMEMLYYGIIKRSQALLAFEVAALTYSFWQIGRYAENFSVFALICCITVAAGTLADEFIKKKRFEVGLLITGTRIVYLMFYILMLVLEFPKFSWMSVAVWTILPAEMIFYGIRSKNSMFIHLQSLELPVLFYVLSSVIGDALGGGYNKVFIFAMLTAAALAVYYIIPAVYTRMADWLYTLMLFGLAVRLLDGAALPYGVIVMAVVAVFIAVQAFGGNHGLQSRIMEFFQPVPEIVTAVMLSGYLEREYNMHCRTLAMGICAAVLCAGAFALGFGSEEERKYKFMKYTMEIGSCVSLFMAYSTRRDLVAALIVTVVSAALYAVIHTSSRNYHSVIPLFTLFMGADMSARAIWYDPMSEGNAVILFSIAMTAVFAVISRLMFRNGIYKKDERRTMLDTAHLGILFCVISCFFVESMMFSPRARSFIALLELAVFAANCIRREHSHHANRAAMTCSAGLVCAALMVRPFMVSENSTITTKIILAIIVLFGIAVKKIWKDDEKLSSEFSQAVFMASFLLLIADGLMNQSLMNSLIVLSISLVLLIFSFVKKTRRWFLVSAAALLGLTLYITGDFLAAVAWWAYLLLAGILLIAVAAVTEYMRQHAVKDPNEERFFVDWKW
ncbi:hypothetical protein [Ruminococcus albus]|nr:hypothetical protein [Ruminococcus albus]